MVITVYGHRTIHSKLKFSQQKFQPHHLTSCISHSSILCFSHGMQHNILLFTLPSKQIASNIRVVAENIFFSFIVKQASIHITHTKNNKLNNKQK